MLRSHSLHTPQHPSVPPSQTLTHTHTFQLSKQLHRRTAGQETYLRHADCCCAIRTYRRTHAVTCAQHVLSLRTSLQFQPQLCAHTPAANLSQPILKSRSCHGTDRAMGTYVFIHFRVGGVAEQKGRGTKCIGNLICANISSHLRGICKLLHKNKRRPPFQMVCGLLEISPICGTLPRTATLDRKQVSLNKAL